MATALVDEPRLRALLDDGEPESCYEATDPDTGLRIKGLLDWDAESIVDLKTCTCRKGRTVDRSIADAIWYEKYHWQAIFYTTLKRLACPGWKGDYVLAFVESDQPHETRLRAIRPGGLLWDRGVLEIRALLRQYKDCMEYYGVDKPWRSACEVSPVADEEIPGVMW
jgi:hypothetical protein